MQIYVKSNRKDYGPYSLEQLRELVEDDTFLLHDSASVDNSGEWTIIKKVPGFKTKKESSAGTVAGPRPTCPYCRGEISPSEHLSCSTCKSPHHEECWQENGGCTVYGCSEAPADEAPIRIGSADLGPREQEETTFRENISVPRSSPPPPQARLPQAGGGSEKTVPWKGIGIAVALLAVAVVILWPPARDGENETRHAVPVEEPLLPVPGELSSVTTIPEGAMIFRNGDFIGRSPLYSVEVPAETILTLTARLDGYREKKELIKLEAGGSGSVDFGNLVEKSGSLLVKLRPDLVLEAETKVFIDDKDFTAMATRHPRSRFFSYGWFDLEEVSVNSRAIKVSHPNYRSWTSDISVREEESITVEAVLDPLPGELIIYVKPESTTIFLNGDNKGKVGKGPRVLSDVAAEEKLDATARLDVYLEQIQIIKMEA
jgi:hypothetical protein